MFGGLVFMVRGKMCVSAGKERMRCRLDPAIHDAALKHKGCRTVVMRKRPYRGYVYIDAQALRAKRLLDYWGAAGIGLQPYIARVSTMVFFHSREGVSGA
jgi:hypothetical protein